MMTKSRRTELEDQGVANFSLEDGVLRLGIDYNDPDKNTKSKVLITFEGIRDLLIDSKPSFDITIMSPNGEIIHFETHDNYMLLIIIWHGDKNKLNQPTSYKFNFKKMTILNT